MNVDLPVRDSNYRKLACGTKFTPNVSQAEMSGMLQGSLHYLFYQVDILYESGEHALKSSSKHVEKDADSKANAH